LVFLAVVPCRPLHGYGYRTAAGLGSEIFRQDGLCLNLATDSIL
jgi:hypothetical protein